MASGSIVLVDGFTKSGRKVVVHGQLMPGYGEYEVEIDNEIWAVVGKGRLRDGGTTTVNLRGPAGEGGRLVFPNRLGSDDRTPRLDGERIEGREGDGNG